MHGANIPLQAAKPKDKTQRHLYDLYRDLNGTPDLRLSMSFTHYETGVQRVTLTGRPHLVCQVQAFVQYDLKGIWTQSRRA